MKDVTVELSRLEPFSELDIQLECDETFEADLVDGELDCGLFEGGDYEDV